MSIPSSKPSQPSATTFNERLNEQLINCLNVQTHVIQNLSQYSQHISLQLFEIKNTVEILSNRVLALQQQLNQQSHFVPGHYATSYYPNYMALQQMPMPHPTHPSHVPLVPFSVQQQPVQMRTPTATTITTSSNVPLLPTTISNPLASLSANIPSFQFSTSTSKPSSQTTIANSSPVTMKSFFSNAPKFSIADTTTKLPSFSTTNVTNEKSSNNSPFAFGNNMTFAFSTKNFNSALPATSPAKPETKADDDVEDDSYEPNVSFKPIVQLSAVEVKTGEEDENILFCERAKLYRFDSATNQMKERGIGEMKILQHKTTNLCRILMRREQVLKLCANHQITSQMELKPHQGSENAYVWSAMDFADGEAKHETLCVRFKTDEQAKKFAKIFNEVKEINTKKSSDMPAIEKVSLNDETKTKSNTDDDDVISIDEIRPSAEQIDRAKKLQLPASFYLYENKEPCKGCPGCEEDTPTIMPKQDRTTTKSQRDEVKGDAETTPELSTTSTPKTPLSSCENNKSLFSIVEKVQSQIEKQASTTKEDKASIESSSPTVNAVSQYDNKPSIFENFNGVSGSSVFGNSTQRSNISDFLFGGGNLFWKASSNSTDNAFTFPGFTTTTTQSNGFQFSTATTSSTSNAPSVFSFEAGTSPSNKILFGNAPKFSFADFAKQSSSATDSDKQTSNGIEDRVFAGQGSLVFGSHTTRKNNDDDDADGGGEDDSYEPNVSFKPIVQLSAVEVKTGEEDENILFCERAKLYRFDSATNQMKERGIGEMKILQHKTTNLCRILMRREQVLKLCANHQITSQMELKPHQGSENAYVWSAMDFADGEAKHETLCVRFKTNDIAKNFLKQFNKAKVANAKAQQ